jgi:hypothetical protein
MFGYVMSNVMWPWGAKAVVGTVLWLPIAALLLLQYTEVIEPDTLSLFAAFMPRVIKFPLLGFLVGYSIETVLAATRSRSR